MSEDDTVGDELRTVGILGGMGNQLTVEYYWLVDEGINDVHGGHHAVELLIRNINFGIIERCIQTERWNDAADYLAAAATDLEADGADLVVMATNTMHRVAPRIEAALPIPFPHIVDAAAGTILTDGLETVGVLGTRATTDGTFYRERFEEYGIDIIVPEESRWDEIDWIVFEELTEGEIREAPYDYYLKAVDRLVERGTDGIVLDCTEIELLVEQAGRPGVPLFGAMTLHVERAVERNLVGRADG